MSTALRDYRVTPRVQVADSSGALQDLSAHLVSATFDSAIDAATDSLTVTFSREDDLGAGGVTGSLAPLMAADPPIALGRLVVVSVAVTALDTAPDPGDFVERFRGYVDRVDWPTKTARVEVSCRDLGGRLLDTWIEEEKEYGSNDGDVSAEQVMQQILDDNNTGVTLHVPTATGSFVPVYAQQEESVMAALRALADSMGWIVRYRYDGSGVSRLTLYSPEREKTTPDHTFGANRYRDVTAMDVDIADIRTRVRVFYVDEDGAEQEVVAINAALEATLGYRRTLTIREGSDSPISNATQAQAMADAALADVSAPLADHGVDTLVVPEVKLGDLISFPANMVHYSSEQRYAVVSHRWTLTRDTHRSQILTRGQPAAGWLRWLDRGRRPGADPRAPTLSPRVVPGATDGLADVYLKVRSEGGATVELRGVEDSESQVWTLVEGDESEEARTVAPGEEIGPSSWWHRDGEWVQHFRDIDTEEGLVRLWVEARDGAGRLSGWTPIIVDRMALAALRLFDFRVIAEDDNGKTHGWKRGAAVRYVFVYDRLLTFEAVTAGESPWPDPDDEQALSDATILHMGTDEYSFLYPPPGRARFVQYEPRAASLASGPVIRRTVLPTSEPPDRLIGGTIRVDHLDGSVRAEVYGSHRAQSIRRAHATADEDEALTDPTDAAVEAGTIQSMTGGVVTIALPPGTVDLGERIRLRVAAYQNADGTGPGGATDHGEIITLEATRTPYRAATLEITTESVDPDAGEVEVGVTLHDTDAVATALYVRRSWGGGAPTAWVLLSGAPADLAEYLSDAPLEPGHDTFFHWRLHQVHRGQEIVTTLTSPGYSYGRIPDGVIVPRLSDSGEASATTEGNFDVKSWRLLASDEPIAIADVQAAAPVDGRKIGPATWGTLHTAEYGDDVYWAALAYSELGGQGRESELITAEAVARRIQAYLQVVLEVEGQGGEEHFEEDDPDIRYGLHVVSPFDPGARSRELWARYREGSAAPGQTLVSSAPDPTTDYSWKVETEEGHPSWIAWDLLYHWDGADTSEFWESLTVTSAIFTAGRVPDFTLFSPYEDEGEVGALMRGNANTLAFRVLAARGAPPSDADVRDSTLRPATNRTLDTGPTLLDPPLEPGETAWLKAFAYELASGDGGKESTEPATGRVRRSAGDDETIRNYIIGISEVRWVPGGGPSGTFDTQALELRIRYPPAVHTIEVTYGDLEAGSHDEVSGTYDFAVGATIARTERLRESDGTTVQEWSATYPVPVQIILRAYGDAAKNNLLAERFIEFSGPQVANLSAGAIAPAFPVEV